MNVFSLRLSDSIRGFSDGAMQTGRQSAQIMDALTFFSSDARPLYKADIFRVLALPGGYTIQFRYEKKWLADEVVQLVDRGKISDQKALIVFVVGNKNWKNQGDSKLRFLPLRTATVKDVFVEQQSTQFVFVLELDQFVEVTEDVLKSGKAELLPPNKFVTPKRQISFVESSWRDRVSTVADYFKDTPFYSFKILTIESTVRCCDLRAKKTYDKPLAPTYVPGWRISEYELNEETDYALEVVYHDFHGEGASPLYIISDTEELKIENPFEHGSGTVDEIRRLAVTTASLDGNSAPAFVTFSPQPSQAKEQPGGAATPDKPAQKAEAELYKIMLRWRLVRKRSKTLSMGFYAALGALGVGLGQLAFNVAYDKDNNLTNPWTGFGLSLASVVFIGVSAAQLFRIFNKK
jgi:hypothetical protein